MDPDVLPSSLIGAIVFFGLIAMIAWLVVRETLRIVLKPALVVALIVLVAVWAGVLEGTAVESALAWIGDRLVLGLTAASEWVANAYEATIGSDRTDT